MAFAWNDADADVYQVDGTELLLWRPAERFLITRLKGQATLAALQFYTGRAEREMSLGRLTVFHEWAEMTGYEPAARDELKRWGKQRNDAFDHVEYLVRSKVVAMLISVAALTLGRDLHATTDEVQFLADLFQALERRGV
ncbi:hypothetical protein SAMN02745121_04185 [Nannocystis exedens]|uniref:Uncharacterized protein n=1 Tax=Nannocystis exedens TaxID=54 RepID=A0A1I2AEX9_9BACT|nr:hypothetical protein [Nannocystis exedens]PCC69759.1 hypothetical protein NAEX_02785 [Nannocystis exedens]SFE41543.1 hypothetical protein SAMN02745121_04185 [Nannocystis exedens]